MRAFEAADTVEVSAASACALAVAGGGCSAGPPLDDPGVPALDPEVALQDALDAGLVVHRAHPPNCETPIAALACGAVMPSARFYVRNHFQIPEISPETWRLRVRGLVERPLSVSLARLRAMPAATAVLTLECAGNGRSGLEPSVPGEQWGVGAASTAEWTGVPLAHVLEQAGVLARAQEAVFRGADRGEVEGRDGPVHFERSLPVGLIGSAGPLLAYAMNGEDLPPRHGYPLRLVVPGWYAVASVKWLTEIELIESPFNGHFQVDRYHIGGEPVTLQRVRSLIIEPRPGETAKAGDMVIRGVAWSGAAPIARVEVSIDQRPWQLATLLGERRRHCWQWWELPVRCETGGDVWVRARATDLAGRAQPELPQWNPLGYGNNLVHQVRVTVSSASVASAPRPQRAEVAATYDRGVEAYDELWSPVILPAAVDLVPSLGLTCRSVVVDIGAGTGALHEAIRATAPAARVVALDASAEMLRVAIARHGMPAARADALALPLASETADAVILAYVLFHLADPSTALAEAARILRPGGRVATITWAWERGSRADEVREEILADAGVPPLPPRRVDAGLDNADALEALLRSVGLRPERVWLRRLRHQWDRSSFCQLASGWGANRARMELVDRSTRARVLARIQSSLDRLKPADFLWEAEVLCAVTIKRDGVRR